VTDELPDGACQCCAGLPDVIVCLRQATAEDLLCDYCRDDPHCTAARRAAGEQQ
jgi:hypothetical protein